MSPTPLWKNSLECVAVLIAIGLLVANIFQTVGGWRTLLSHTVVHSIRTLRTPQWFGTLKFHGYLQLT